ncbi:MAG: CoA transferase [Bryobacterales bacterium]|nr:CoA transferase [Bryobacterales bacterium]
MSRPAFLRGCRIVDLSMGWAGPLATRHLADMGAEIIKVESCARFDWFRGWESSQRWIDDNEAEKHEPFNALNRNKFDVTLDLSTRRGRDLLLRLVAVSDAIIENFAGDVLPKLNLGFEVFKAVKPEIVMVSMPGFGSAERGASIAPTARRPNRPPACRI